MPQKLKPQWTAWLLANWSQRGLLTLKPALVTSRPTHLSLQCIITGLLLWGEALVFLFGVVIWSRRQVGRWKAAELRRCLMHISYYILNLTGSQALNIHDVLYTQSCELPEFNHFLHDLKRRRKKTWTLWSLLCLAHQAHYIIIMSSCRFNVVTTIGMGGKSVPEDLIFCPSCRAASSWSIGWLDREKIQISATFPSMSFWLLQRGRTWPPSVGCCITWERWRKGEQNIREGRKKMQWGMFNISVWWSGFMSLGFCMSQQINELSLKVLPPYPIMHCRPQRYCTKM